MGAVAAGADDAVPGAGAVMWAGDALPPDVAGAAVDPDDGVAADDGVGVSVGVDVEFDVGVGVGVAVVDVGDAVVGAGLGVIVLVTQGCSVESRRDAPLRPGPLPVARVRAVLVITAPPMPKPLAPPTPPHPALRPL